LEGFFMPITQRNLLLQTQGHSPVHLRKYKIELVHLKKMALTFSCSSVAKVIRNAAFF